MKLNVPYISQFNENIPEKWKDRVCIIVCLEMALKFLGVSEVGTLDLIEEGELIKGDLMGRSLLTPKQVEYGLPHDIIVFIAHNHGISAYKEEFRSIKVDLENQVFLPSSYESVFLEKGIRKIADTIRRGSPVLASVHPGLSDGTSFHAILLIGFEEKNKQITGFYYHDPDARDNKKDNLFLSLVDFVKYWRRMAIFIGE